MTLDVPFDLVAKSAPAVLMAFNAPPPPSEEGWRNNFGNLLYTSSRDLIALGTRIRKEVFDATTTSSRVVEKVTGTFSLVCILELDHTKMAIRIPACGRSGSLTYPADEWLQSHVRTLKFVRDCTTIPVPEVYWFDTTARNEISAPYIAMSCIDGRRVADLWFDEDGPTPLETRRRRILEHLAQLMSQLNVPRFDEIASLMPNRPFDPGDGLTLGSCFGWDITDDGLLTVNSSPPFVSSKAWLKNYRVPPAEIQEKSDLAQGTYKLLKTMLSQIPNQTSGFALAPERFDWENVMADEEGNITGLVNWGCAQTTPNLLGCLRYPLWIVHERGGHDSSPRKLQEYRAYYLEQMKAALAQQGPSRAGDYTYTANSKAVEAFWLAYTNRRAQVDMCQEFVEAAKEWLIQQDAMVPGLRESALRILENLGGDRLEYEAKEALVKGLKTVMGS